MKKTIWPIMIFMILSITGCKQENIQVRLKEETFTHNGIQIPVILGEPKLSLEYLSKNNYKSISSMKKEIETYADAMVYLKDRAYSVKGNDIVNDLCNLLNSDYDDIASVTIQTSNDFYYVLSIKVNDRYYILDPSADHRGSNEWLQNYNLEEGSFESKEQLLKALSISYPISDIHNVFYTPTSPEGAPIYLKNTGDELTYEYSGFEYNANFGYPTFSAEDIDTLIAEYNAGNFDVVKEKISTVPDMVYFLKQVGFKEAGMNNIKETEIYGGPDVGNIFYHDDIFSYTISGKELLMVNEGQCSATATLFRYLLGDDYDEVGYVVLNFINKDNGGKRLDGHVINYIKNNDMYYLVSPSYYLSGDTAWRHYDELRKGYSSLEEAMEVLNNSDYPNGKVVASAAFLYDCIYLMSDKRDSNQIVKRTFPEGADVKVCIGSSYDFALPKHPTDQNYILGVELKN